MLEKELNELKALIEKEDWEIYDDTENSLTIGKFSPQGQDFQITVDLGESIYEFKENLYSLYSNFDVSEETYIWLDDSGHGKNGAPYDMKDVYEDFEACEENIYNLYLAL